LIRYEVVAPENSELRGKVIETERTDDFTHWIWWFDDDADGLTVCPEEIGVPFALDQTVALPVRRLP
jgi:hypothetical protein